MTMKLVKTAAALALGASVITSAVVSTDASAASKYKVKSGKLVIAKTGKVAKGYVTFNKLVYKDGKKLTGLKGKVYYKAGKKATGTYKGAYYLKGTKKVTTGTYNKAYYVKGVKKATTGLYASKYYKDGKLATGTYKSTYYVNGVKKATTGTYNKAYYVKGKKVVTTGIYKEQFYKDGALNKSLALFEGELYDGAKLNAGIKAFKDEKGKELYYFDADLAEGTYEVDGKEEAFEKGLKVAAKVSSVEAVNGTTLEVKFNKAVDAEAIKAANLVTIEDAALSNPILSKDGRTLTFDYAFVEGKSEFKNATVTVNPIVTKADAKISTPKFVYVVNFKDTAAPAIAEVTTVNKPGKKVDVTISFNKALKSIGLVSVDGIVADIKLSDDKKSIVLKDVDAGSTKKVEITDLEDNIGNKATTVSTTIVTSEDTTAPLATFTMDGTDVKVKFSEEVNVTGAIVKGNDTDLALSKIDDDGFYTIDAARLLKENETFLKDVKFTVAGVTDLAGNATEKTLEFTSTIQKPAATAAAKYVSSTVATDGKTITVNYDKEVKLPTDKATFTYVYTDAEGILYRANDQKLEVAATKLSDDKKSVIYAVDGLVNGAYTFTFGEQTFTGTVVKEEVVEPVTASVTLKAEAVKNVITVKYSEVMDDSAKQASNYTLAGQALPAGTTLNFVGNKQTVEIALPAGSIENVGSRVLSISNVVAKSGNTLTSATTNETVALEDNVAPTTSGVATINAGTTASVLFSENLVADVTIVGATVKVNGTVLDAAKYDLTIDGKQLVVTLKAGATNFLLSDAVTVELKDTNLMDASENVAIVK